MFSFDAKLLGKFLPSSIEGFVRFLFWHSIFFTASTPIMRVVTKKWLYVLSAPLVVGMTDDAISETYPPAEEVDRAWIPHAIFGLLWLCVGSAQFLITPQMEGKIHKFFGYFTIVVFCGHLSAAYYTLYIDGMKHTIVNKLFLVNDLTEGAIYMTLGMLAVIQRKKGWLQKHKDQMFLAFVTSIEGAGTIRTIGFVHYLMGKAGLQDTLIWSMTGAGLSECQNKHRMVSSDCEWEYTFRLTTIRFLTNLYVHQYATFTPSCVEIANQRWKSWVTMITILGMAADQDIPPHYAFGAVVLSSAYNHGYLTKIYNKISKMIMERIIVPLARKVVEQSGSIIVEVPVPARKVAEGTSNYVATSGEAVEEIENTFAALGEESTQDEQLEDLDRARSSHMLNPAPEGQTPAPVESRTSRPQTPELSFDEADFLNQEPEGTPYRSMSSTPFTIHQKNSLNISDHPFEMTLLSYDEVPELGTRFVSKEFLLTPTPGGSYIPMRRNSITFTTTIEGDFDLRAMNRGLTEPAANRGLTEPACRTPKRLTRGSGTPRCTSTRAHGTPRCTIPRSFSTDWAEHRREFCKLLTRQELCAA